MKAEEIVQLYNSGETLYAGDNYGDYTSAGSLTEYWTIVKVGFLYVPNLKFELPKTYKFLTSFTPRFHPWPAMGWIEWAESPT